MTSATDLPPASAPATAPEPKPNPFARIGGVITTPVETFQSIARRPDWVVPLLLIIVITIAGGIIVASRVDFTTLARESMEMNPNSSQIPADRMDTAVKWSAATMKMFSYAGFVAVVVALIIVAAVLLVSCRLFGGEGTFVQAFSVTLYAWVPRVVKSIIGVIVIFTRPNIGLFDLQNPVMSNLGFLANPKSNLLLYTVLTSIDLFSIWSIVLMIIGFSIATKLSRGRSAAIVIGWWIVINLFSLIGPALQMLRR